MALSSPQAQAQSQWDEAPLLHIRSLFLLELSCQIVMSKPFIAGIASPKIHFHFLKVDPGDHQCVF